MARVAVPRKGCLGEVCDSCDSRRFLACGWPRPISAARIDRSRGHDRHLPLCDCATSSIRARLGRGAARALRQLPAHLARGAARGGAVLDRAAAAARDAAGRRTTTDRRARPPPRAASNFRRCPGKAAAGLAASRRDRRGGRDCGLGALCRAATRSWTSVTVLDPALRAGRGWAPTMPGQGLELRHVTPSRDRERPADARHRRRGANVSRSRASGAEAASPCATRTTRICRTGPSR